VGTFRLVQGFFADKDAGAKAAGQKVEKPKAPTEQYADFMKARCVATASSQAQREAHQGLGYTCHWGSRCADISEKSLQSLATHSSRAGQASEVRAESLLRMRWPGARR